MNKLISTKNRVFLALVGPSETGKSQHIHSRLKIRSRWQFFYQHSQTLYDVMLKHIENLEFFQGVHFHHIDSLKNNGKK